MESAKKKIDCKDKDMQKLIGLMIKQILKSEQSNRDVEGALFDTFLGKSECPVVLSAQAQGAAYQAQVKAKGKGHALGPPQIWVFGGLLDALVKQGDKVGAQTATDLKKCLSEYSDATVESKCELERFFRPHSPVSEPSALGAAAAGMDTTIWPSPTVAFGLRASGVAGSADETVAALREIERLVKQQFRSPAWLFKIAVSTQSTL